MNTKQHDLINSPMIHLQIRHIIWMQIFGPHLFIAKVNISYQEPNLESSAPILTHFYSTVRAIQQILPIVLEYPTFTVNVLEQ